MANKYKKEAKQCRLHRKKQKMCVNKASFATEEEAYQKGQDSYKCPFCHLWHRSGAFKTFANNLCNRS